MLISHRRSAYVDDDELERAAGMMKIRAETCGDPTDALLWCTASSVLRILCCTDLRSCDELVGLFESVAFPGEGE